MINSVYEVCNIIANKNNYGILTPQRANLLFKNAQIKIISDLIDQYRRSKADKGNTKRVMEIEHTMSVFYQYATLQRALSGTTILDYFELPSDILIDDEYYYNTNQPVTLVGNKEFSTYARMRDTKPDMNNIYGYKTNGTLYLYPSSIGKVGTGSTTSTAILTSDVGLGYWRQPTDPALAYQSGTTILDPTEPYDFELPLQYHDKLVVETLLQVGISLREEQVYVYARNERQQETNNENA